MRIRSRFSLHGNESSICSRERDLSELALRLVTCGRSEADADGLLSMQHNIAGLHGTHFGLPSMKERLREWTNRLTQAQVSFGAMGGGDELDDSDPD
jgi:hypothetical protein